MDEAFDLEVYYFSDASIKGNLDVGFNQNVKWDIPLLEGYQFKFLKNISSRKSLSNNMWDVINPSVIKILYKSKGRIVIINGWSYFSNLLVIYFGKLFGKQIWLRAENPLNQELQKSKRMLTVKKFILKYCLFPFVDKFLYIGSESKKFFSYYGVEDSKMVFTPYAVDNERFKKLKDDLDNKINLREQLNLPVDKSMILFTGKYIDKKRPLDLIKAFHLLNDESCVLVMVGEGNLRKQMEHFIAKHKIKNVYLTGFVNQSLITSYYAAADIFVMCSGMGETWGLSVNEAMCFSLPVVVSETCGCSPDLVQSGINGFIFKEGNIKALTAAIKKLIDDKNFRIKCGQHSLEIIDNYTNKIIVSNISNEIG